MNTIESDNLKQEFLFNLGKQCLQKLKVKFTEDFLKEAIRKAYVLAFEREYTDQFDQSKITVADKEDPGNLAIVLLEALKRYHIKNEIGSVYNKPTGVVALLILSSPYNRYDYQHLLTVENEFSNANEPITKTIENLVVLKTNKYTGEPGYILNRNKEKLNKGFKLTIALLLSMAFGMIVYKGNVNYSWSVWLPPFIFLFAGCSVCYHLFKLEKSNIYVSKLLKKVCNSGKNDFDCKRVISSSGAKLFGIISQTDIGVIYFSSMLFFLAMNLLNNTLGDGLSFLFWSSVFPLPYVIFSIYYQFRVLKKICILCMMIQLILCLQFTWYLFLNQQMNVSAVSLEVVVQAGLVIGIITMLYYLFIENKRITILERAAALENWKFKNSASFFEEAMAGQIEFINDDFPVMFSIGDSAAQVKIQVILSLFCSPCGDRLKDLLKLADWFEDKIDMQFIIKPDKSAASLIKELMLYFERGETQRGLDILTHWYTFFQKEKELGTYNPAAIIAKWNDYYPTTTVSAQIEAQYAFHLHFYENYPIPFTPLLQYNGKLLPGIYQDMELLSNRIEHQLEHEQNLEYA